MQSYCQSLGLGIAGLLILSCSSTTGSSFETLGVPDVSPPPSRAAIIVGWEEEQREGWVLSHVRVDGQSRSEWDRASQHPVVIYLEPGRRSVQILAEQRQSGGRGSVVRRYRSKAVEFQAEERESELCVVRVAGKRRRRPRISCTDHGRHPAARAHGNDRSSHGKRAVIAMPASSELVESPYPSSGPPDQSDEPNAKQLMVTPYSSTQEPTPEPLPPTRADLLNNPYVDQAPLTERIRLLEERLERIERALTQQGGEEPTP